MQDTLSLIHDEAALQRFNVTMSASAGTVGEDDSFATEAWFQEECDLVDTFWKLLVELASARCWSQVQFTTLQPSALAAVLCADKTAAQRALNQQRAIWGAVIEAEQAASADSNLPPGDRAALVKLLQDLGWNRLQVAREAMIECTAAGWQASHPQIQAMAKAFFSGPAQTKTQLEDLFAHLASVSRASNLPVAMNKRLGSSELLSWFPGFPLRVNLFGGGSG